jgi:hypothetical protein
MLSKQLDETWFVDGKFSGGASRREQPVGIVSNNVETLRRRGETVNQAKVRKSNKADHLSLACKVSAHIAAIPLCHGVKPKPGNAVSAALGEKAVTIVRHWSAPRRTVYRDRWRKLRGNKFR